MRTASLQRRLLATLLAVFVGAWLVLVAVTYEEARHEIEEVFDANLAQAAGLLADITRSGAGELSAAERVLSRAVYGHKYERAVGFQIWRGGELLFRSQSAPETAFGGERGYFDETVGGVRWRVFALDLEDGWRVYAGESYFARDELTHDIALSTLVPLLVAIPVLGLLVRIAIVHGLAPLHRVAREVAGRDPDRLEPIAGGRIPAEIETLVHAVNSLLVRLDDALERERRFTADAAHELRTPLAALKAQCQVALAARDAGERDRALAGVVTGVERATRLVEQLLDLARVDPQTRVRAPRLVDLSEVAEQVLADLYAVACRRGVTLAFDDLCGPEDRVGCIDGDEAGLYALLRNLVDNAIRHAPSDSEVTVTLDRAEDRLRLVVEDCGAGIPEAERERVFRRFYRGADDRRGSGAGLGLAIVGRLAELHGARIVLGERAGGSGLRVEVRFPLPRSAAKV